MSLLTLATLPFSADYGWAALARQHSAPHRLLAFLVLPAALLPPAMLYLAGTRYPGIFPPELAGKPWGTLAAAFLLTELATLLLIGWLLGRVARSLGLAIDDRAAFLIAALAPLPLWLSSLALLVPDLGLLSGLALLALLLSFGIVYHGLVGLGRVRESVMAAATTHMALGAGLIPWVLLLAVVMT